MYLICHVISHDHLMSPYVTTLTSLVILIACHHPAKFGGHMYCGSTGIINVFSLLRDLLRPRD